MPDSKHKQKARIARRRRVAAGLVEGKEIKEIAAVERVSTRTVLRDLKDPETTELLARLVRHHGPDLERLFARSLRAVDQALDATIPAPGDPTGAVKKRGEKARTLPDHRSRLWAVQQLARLLQVCATRSETDHQQRGWTWSELRQVWLEAQRG